MTLSYFVFNYGRRYSVTLSEKDARVYWVTPNGFVYDIYNPR